MKAFFINLRELLSQSFTANKICNLDETGNSAVHVSQEITGNCAKGIKKVGIVTAWKRRINVTMFVAVNAIGNHVPPMFIIPKSAFEEPCGDLCSYRFNWKCKPNKLVK